MINWDARSGFSGTSFQGYLDAPWSFEETVARIITASGQKPESMDGDKVSVDFGGSFNGYPFTLYDYKGDMTIHIGGNRSLDVEALKVELLAGLALVEPTPYETRVHYEEVRGRIHGWPK